MYIETRTNTHEDDRSRARLTRAALGALRAAFPVSAASNLKSTYEETKRFASPHPSPDRPRGLRPGSTVASAGTVNAVCNSATDVPVTASGYTATGNTVNFTLNFAPATGTDLMVVKNTGLGFINGTFDNLAKGQAVALSYGGITYPFVANYYGGSGNDLVLVWANNRAFRLGRQLRRPTRRQHHDDPSQLPVPVTATGVSGGQDGGGHRGGRIRIAWRSARTAPWPPGATTTTASLATTPRRSASCRWR